MEYDDSELKIDPLYFKSSSDTQSAIDFIRFINDTVSEICSSTFHVSDEWPDTILDDILDAEVIG